MRMAISQSSWAGTLPFNRVVSKGPNGSQSSPRTKVINRIKFSKDWKTFPIATEKSCSGPQFLRDFMLGNDQALTHGSRNLFSQSRMAGPHTQCKKRLPRTQLQTNDSCQSAFIWGKSFLSVSRNFYRSRRILFGWNLAI